MTSITFHSAPCTRAVLLAQIRAVGFAPRGPVLAAIAVVAVATLLITIESLKRGEVIPFQPQRQMLPGPRGPSASHRRLERGRTVRDQLPLDAPRGPLAARARQSIRRMGLAHGRRRAFRALVARADTRFGREHPRGRDTSRSQLLLSLASPTLDPAALETVRRMPQPLFWPTPFTRRPPRTCSPARWGWPRVIPCGGSSGA